MEKKLELPGTLWENGEVEDMTATVGSNDRGASINPVGRRGPEVRLLISELLTILDMFDPGLVDTVRLRMAAGKDMPDFWPDDDPMGDW